MSEDKTATILVELGHIRAVLMEVREEAKLTNGRVRANEAVIAVLKWSVALIGSVALATYGTLLGAAVWVLTRKYFE